MISKRTSVWPSQAGLPQAGGVVGEPEDAPGHGPAHGRWAGPAPQSLLGQAQCHTHRERPAHPPRAAWVGPGGGPENQRRREVVWPQLHTSLGRGRCDGCVQKEVYCKYPAMSRRPQVAYEVWSQTTTNRLRGKLGTDKPPTQVASTSMFNSRDIISWHPLMSRSPGGRE